MTPERWQQIDKLLEQALELEPVRRDLFLHDACSGDDELRREWKPCWRHMTGEEVY